MRRKLPKFTRLSKLTASRRGRITLIVVAVVLGLGVFAGAFVGARLLTDGPEQGSIDRSLQGVDQPDEAAQPAPDAAPKPVDEGPCWPVYGRTAGRLSDAADLGHGRPMKRLWSRRIGMMEFPPAYCDGVLYVNSQHGLTRAINVVNRKDIWSRTTAKMFDSTPAVTDTRVFIGSYDPGTVQALDRKTGRLLWKLKAGGAVESSPVVVDGLVYATSKDRRIYAIDEVTGRVRWAFRTAGEIKDSPSVANGMVYFANYAAEVYALDAKTGKVRWRKTFGGIRGDRIYSSVPVRGGTVWFATVRGDIYALNARTGATRWHQSIPGYVYSTPAISGDRLFIGNYPGSLYAFNAATGKRLWDYRVGGSISGSPTVIGKLVYVSSLSATKTVGLTVATGKRMWQINQGRYVTGIGTDRALYFSLGSTLIRYATDRTPLIARTVATPPAPAG